jgi:hypothetical protein
MVIRQRQEAIATAKVARANELARVQAEQAKLLVQEHEKEIEEMNRASPPAVCIDKPQTKPLSRDQVLLEMDESYDEFTESISAASEDADDTLKDVEEEEVQEEESEYVASKYRFRDKTKYRH